MRESTSPINFGLASVAVALVMTVGGGQRESEPLQLEPTAAGTFFACATKAAGKLVTGSPSTWNLVERRTASCPATASQLTESLTKSESVLKETEDAAYVVPKAHLVSDGFSVQFPWTRIGVALPTKAWEKIPDAVELSPSILERIGILARRQMRPIPVTPIASADGTSGIVTYETRVSAQRLSASETTHVVVITKADEYARLGFALLERDTVRLLWDSPLFGSWMLRLGYSDLDGDERKEILIGTATGMRATTIFHAFTADGVELTRQAPCPDEVGGNVTGTACGIAGETVEIATGANKSKDLIATPREGERVRYVLSDGRYRPQ